MKIEKIIQKITENWKVKVTCILAAIIIYIICQIAFLERRAFSVPLRVKNASNLVYINQIPRLVRVSVRGEANQIGLLQENDFDVFVDLSEFVEAGTYKVPLHLQLSEEATMIEDLEILISPDLIELNLEPKITALVPLKTNVSGTCAKGYEVTAIEIYPDLVQITGSQSLVEKTSFLETSIINLNEKSSSFTENVEVVNQNPRLSLTGQKEFEVTVKINPIRITKKIESSVVFYNSLKDGLRVENPNISYTLTLSGTKNELEDFVLSPLSVQVDCSSIETSGTYDLPFSVVLPNGITFDKIEPADAKVNIVDFVGISVPENQENQQNSDTEETSSSEKDSLPSNDLDESKESKNTLPITD